MNRHDCLLVLVLPLLAGCVTTSSPSNDVATSFGYYPIDPMPVMMALPEGYTNAVPNEHILSVLPDETMRLAIGSVDAKGGITYGPAAAEYSHGRYVVVLDYAKCTVVPVAAILQVGTNDTVSALAVSDPDEADAVVPAYAGIGLRLTADITVNNGKVNLGSLYGLGVAAEAGKISGSLTVQTLGISGESVSTLLPMPSEINTATIQNAILALGAIKAKLYDEGIHVTPRVIGFSNTYMTDEMSINLFISSLLAEPSPIQPINLIQQYAIQDE